MLTLKGKTVLVTGASSGIGAACAKQCAALGAKLILTARRKERLQALADELKAQYQTATHLLALDVRDRKAVQKAIAGLPAEWQDIDVLVNNAGLAAGKAVLQEADLDDVDVMVDTNVKGLLYVTRAVLPLMLKRQKGHVINIGSTAAHHAYKGGTVYCATKAAVRSISAGLKQDVLGTPIRITEIDPGFAKTEFSNVRFKGDAAKAEQVYQGVSPLTADDIADAVVYAATRPPHVNIMELVIHSVDQAGGGVVFRHE